MKTMLFAMAIWVLTAAMSYGQNNALTPGHEYEVERNRFEMGKPNLADSAKMQAVYQKQIDSGQALFGADSRWGGWWAGKRFGSRSKGYEGTIAHKKPPDFQVGDWGCESYPFQAVSKVGNLECLVTIKYQADGDFESRRSDALLLRGLDMSKVTDGVEFVLQHPVVIENTYSYTAVSGARNTVLVLECNSAKIDAKIKKQSRRPLSNRQRPREHEKEQEDAIEAAKWRTWTDSTGQHKVEAKFSGAAFGTVKLTKRDGSAVKVSLDQLSDEDREWIKRQHK